ncbi:MAG: hypothetical protein ACKVWR_17005, partial [Acidimicrobiales bacterium]
MRDVGEAAAEVGVALGESERVALSGLLDRVAAALGPGAAGPGGSTAGPAAGGELTGAASGP